MNLRCFNPRPPRGGRRFTSVLSVVVLLFQSTPPAWGATGSSSDSQHSYERFNPRPPRGGRRVGGSTCTRAI